MSTRGLRGPLLPSCRCTLQPDTSQDDQDCSEVVQLPVEHRPLQHSLPFPAATASAVGWKIKIFRYAAVVTPSYSAASTLTHVRCATVASASSISP